MTFDENGRVMVSCSVSQEDLERLGLGDLAGKESGGFSSVQARYMAKHRQRFEELATYE